MKMYTDEVRTPQALQTHYYSKVGEVKCRSLANNRRSSANNSAESCATPTNGAKQKMSCSPKMSIICTPPPKRFHKVRNPFEGALTDRLHLPLIASPSLFQCRSHTPQLSSTQFEWDIEEVSQLKPADVEPHETQFHDSPDPEQESKAQLAISTFFKESQIVPSPVDCPLRSRRIILSEIQGDTPISNKTTGPRRVRDCEVQTELTLPPVLPKALEDALRPYLQPHLAGSMSVPRKSPGGDIFNSSMRRKLFDLHNVVVLGESQQPEQDHVVGSSPQAKQTLFAGRLSDSTGDEGSNSFGCLSPIRNSCGLRQGTPDDGNGYRKRKSLLHELELPSPIAQSEHLSRRMRNVEHTSRSSYREQSNTSEHVTLSELTTTGCAVTHNNFTPERSSSPMQLLEYSSTDCSINQRVSRLRVNSTRQIAQKLSIQEVEETGGEDDNEGEDDEPETEDEDGMQVSQLSTHSFNCSSSNSDTPRGLHRRSANRKNLSQSFNANTNWSDDEAEQVDQPDQEQAQNAIRTIGNTVEEWLPITNDLPTEPVGFYRTDSGFNDTSSVSTFAFSQELPASDGGALDVSMVCCSTPSTRS
ncbi:protein aurora borealis [Scaptodrosophila lebanonensis]|uniref:Protein aurora borealis n=1 Tax=Drosophila lebanonensis TaxID=7225 RepID=A0A6J2TBW3_DROLE|nr:protein aurora borealis [Scaptodrosophila lebanonensis]